MTETINDTIYQASSKKPFCFWEDISEAVACKTIKKGHIIKKEDLTWKRPAYGISPQYLEEVVGKIAKIDIAEDTIILGDMYVC